MDKIHYAAIDIGSNAVRLLIKCVNNDDAEELLSKVQLIRVPLRLGLDSFTIGKIPNEKRQQLLSLMKAYKELMHIYKVKEYRACATSAMRDAMNNKEIVKEIYLHTGILVEVIDGLEEASLISDNKIEKLVAESGDVFLYCDVGGGSTELNLVYKGTLIYSISFNIGTIRYLSGQEKNEERLAFENHLKEIKAKYDKINIVGTGGNINKLLRLGAPTERKSVNFLKANALKSVVEDLSKYSAEDRMIKFQLKPDRSDVIVPAGNLFLKVLENTKADGILVPSKGLADGIIDSIYRKNL